MEFIVPMKKSPEDSRDYIFISNNSSIPEECDLRSELMPVRNQGSQGTCYAQSASCMKEWQERKNYNFNEYFSPQFFYNLRFNKYDKNTQNDEGMFGRDVMKILKNIGICKESTYPYGRIEDRDKISKEILDEAKMNIIESYARINTINDLKASLCKNGPALIAFPVYNYTDQMWIQRNNESSEGGHAMTVVGYNNDGFIIRNSWGQSWGDNGYTIYKYKDWSTHWEIWSTVDKKDIFQEPDFDSDTEYEQEINCFKCTLC
jgi:C1A family cysteine protease